MIKTSLTGVRELNDQLADLGSILGKKAVRKAAKEAMLPVLADVIATAPKDEETKDNIHLSESFKITVSGRTAKDRRNNTDTFLSSSVRTANKQVETYAALVEFGREEFIQKRTNFFGIPSNPYNVLIGSMKPNPFMRTALSKNANNVVNTFISVLSQEITKIQSRRDRIAKSKIKAMERKAGRAV